MGNLLVAPMRHGNLQSRHPRIAARIGVLNAQPGTWARLLDSGFARIATFGTVGKTKASSLCSWQSVCVRAFATPGAMVFIAAS